MSDPDEFQSLAIRQRNALDFMGVEIERVDGDVVASWRDSDGAARGENTVAALAELLGISRMEAHDLLARVMDAQRHGDPLDGTTRYQWGEFQARTRALLDRLVERARDIVSRYDRRWRR